MPTTASNSSMSPARRIENQRPALPFVHPGPHAFANPRPLQSPQSYTNGYSHVGMFATPATDSRRQRNSIGYTSGNGILPTPDPTVGSCMSEEDKDVAIQLMRLGEMTNVSHGRTSASTLDDTFSGKADVASSTGATSEGDSGSEDELPPPRRQKLDLGASRKLYQTTESHFIPPGDSVDASGDDADYEDGNEDASRAGVKPNEPKPKVQKPRAPSSKASTKPKAPKALKVPNASKIKKSNGLAMGPMSPASLPNHSRKPSIASVSVMSGPAGEEEQPDLSTKPRCQRCRKSKKGCDRQRPCGRCRDAGLSADQCISEDEGNGRKGRYGRHMGVPIKTTDIPGPPTLLPAAPIPMPMTAVDKNKKRKR